jgi:hypothetical protein
MLVVLVHKYMHIQKIDAASTHDTIGVIMVWGTVCFMLSANLDLISFMTDDLKFKF